MWLLWRENSVRLESIGEWILVIFYDSLEDFWMRNKMLKELDFEKLDDEMVELNNKIIKGMWVVIERIGLKYNFSMIIWKSYTITFRSNNFEDLLRNMNIVRIKFYFCENIKFLIELHSYQKIFISMINWWKLMKKYLI